MTQRGEKETNTPKSQQKKTQPTHISHALAARGNQDQETRRAAARHHTPSPPRHAAPNAATHKAKGKKPEQIAA
jgi:hypothetical protein